MVKLAFVKHRIVLTEGVSASISGDVVTLIGPNGTLSREFIHTKTTIELTEEGLLVRCDIPRRKEAAVAGTWAAHLRNMNKGAAIGFTYKLKAVYSHFPMSLKVEGNRFVVNNYFGEKVPRRAKLPWPSEVNVKVKGKTDVIVTGADREKVGQTAANIERSCTIKKRDRRVFQDGIYLVEKI